MLSTLLSSKILKAMRFKKFQFKSLLKLTVVRYLYNSLQDKTFNASHKHLTKILVYIKYFQILISKSI